MDRHILSVMLAVALLSLVGAGAAFAEPDLKAAPEQVSISVGAVLIDLVRIDTAKQSMTADLALSLTWRDERMAHAGPQPLHRPAGEVWVPGLQLATAVDVDALMPEVVEIAPDGTVTSVQRFAGEFSTRLDFRPFPMDRHRIPIRLVITGLDQSRVNITVNQELAGMADHLTIADWDIGGFGLHPEPFQVIAGARTLASVVVDFEARRRLGFYIGKALVSVAIIIFMSWVVFWLPVRHVNPRMSISVTSMLTLIAYRFLLSSDLPKLSYLTRLDYFLLGSTVMVFAALVVVAFTTSLDDRGHGDRATTINRHSRWVFPLLFAAVLLFSFTA